MLSKAASSTIFWVFGMTRPGTEPRSPGPLVNTLLIRPMATRVKCLLTLPNDIHINNSYEFWQIFSFIFLKFELLIFIAFHLSWHSVIWTVQIRNQDNANTHLALINACVYKWQHADYIYNDHKKECNNSPTDR